MTIKQLLERATGKLTASPSAAFDAELLLSHVLDVSRSFLYANPQLPLSTHREIAFVNLLQRRAAGEPIAYLTGHRAFWTLDLKVTPDVLIPRPESELLVEAALERLPREGFRRIADLGTGSGAIALAIARERPNCEVHATDCSASALELARHNARRHGLERVRFHLGHWAEPLAETFDLIVSNPPYVAGNDPHLESGDCRFEPRTALTPGADGLEAIRQIVGTVGAWLQPGGWLLLEHGYDQGEKVAELLLQQGFREISTIRDLAGHDRVSISRHGG